MKSQKSKIQRRARKPADAWAQIVRDWERSGQTAVVYGNAHDVSPHSLWRWRMRLQNHQTQQVSVDSPTRFVPVKASVNPHVEEFDGRVELEWPSGHRVRLQGRMSPACVQAMWTVGPDAAC